EKASWFARLGQFLPPYDSHATLTALAREVERTGASRLFCLGDSFHDQFGCDRLAGNARELLIELTSRLDWTWIVGNHDPGFTDHCGGRIQDEVELRNCLAARGATQRPASRNVGPLSSETASPPERPSSLPPLFRGLADENHSSGVRLADRRAGRPSSRDLAVGRKSGSSLGA